MGWAARCGIIVALNQPMECPMPKSNDLSKSLVALDENSTLIAVVDMSQSSWLVVGRLPGVERHPLKKLGASEDALLALLQRWRDRKSTRLNSSHSQQSRMPSSA